MGTCVVLRVYTPLLFLYLSHGLDRGRRFQRLTSAFPSQVPWKVLSSAKVFLNLISGYAIVLGPFAGIMCCDFYFAKRQKVDVPALYDPHGRYRFTGGVNWRCVVALIISVAPNLYVQLCSARDAVAAADFSSDLIQSRSHQRLEPQDSHRRHQVDLLRLLALRFRRLYPCTSHPIDRESVF